jgi:hypothetical protein
MGESRRHRDAEIRHLGEVRALPTEHVAHLARALGRAVSEEVDRAMRGTGVVLAYRLTPINIHTRSEACRDPREAGVG